MNNNNIIDDWQTNQENQLKHKIEVKVSRDMINDLLSMYNIDIETLKYKIQFINLINHKKHNLKPCFYMLNFA